MLAVSLMIVGACLIVAGFAWIWPPLAVIVAGALLIAAGLDLANRTPRRREATG